MVNSKQLTFGASFAPPPTKDSEIIAKLYIDHITNIIVEWINDDRYELTREEVREGVVDFVKNDRDNDNGYEVACSLESYCGINPDSALVAELDDLPFKRKEIELLLLRDWIANYRIEPLLNIGDTATSPGITGQIKEIHKSVAKYCIRHQNPDYSRLVPFEDVQEHMEILKTLPVLSV